MTVILSIVGAFDPKSGVLYKHNIILYTKISTDSEDEWEIVEDEIISSYVNEEIVGTSEPKF